MTDDIKQSREVFVLFGIAAVFLVISGIGPVDRATWWLEVGPVFLGIPLLLWLRPGFPFTPLLYRLLFIHACIVMLGGHYTYVQVLLGDWVRDWFGLERNNYDRLGHLAQGFIPAILMRELLWRKSPLRGSRWLSFLVVCFCLAFSALFEMLEWWVALIMGGSADAFLALQGDVWDTQWDMFLALCGAIVSLLLLSRLHDRQLIRLVGEQTEK